MPKIEVCEKPFYRLIGRTPNREELVDLLVIAKAELDEYVPGEELLKIELNDTNRPDLWSTAGLARQLHDYLETSKRRYGFFSRSGDIKEAEDRVIRVDPALEKLRPYITAFIADGQAVDNEMLKDIIQSQEKLCFNYGQRRRAVAMGVYRSRLMKFPVQYRAADPDSTRFVPLEMEKELSLREILKEHPKGVEFGWIVEEMPFFPYLEDREGGTLSFPPIINSAQIGAVEVGEDSLFIELTGSNLDVLLLATSITACDFADLGFRILPVKTEYPYDTPYGRSLVTPYYFQKPVTLENRYAGKLLGENLGSEEIAGFLEKVGHEVETADGSVTLSPPPFRNDFLHPADIVEEVMIGRGMESFEPILPDEATFGRLSPIEVFCRDARDIMIGLGYQEMIFNYLGSRRDFMDRMGVTDDGFIEIANPMTENYAVVRRSILPNLLSSESGSGNAVYPHRIFETGKVAFTDSRENYGSRTCTYLGFLCADREAGFNDVNSHVSALFFYLNREFTLSEMDDPRFITGRSGEIICNGRTVGVLGEIHPQVLENWGIQMPCACAEVELDALLDI